MMDNVFPISAGLVLQILHGGDSRWAKAHTLAETGSAEQACDVAYEILSENGGSNVSMDAIRNLCEEDTDIILNESRDLRGEPLTHRLKYFIALFLFKLETIESDDGRLPDSAFRLYKFIVDQGIAYYALYIACELGDQSTTEATFNEAERYYLMAINNTKDANRHVFALMGYASLLADEDSGKPDHEKELSVLAQAAKKGCLTAMWNLAMSYFDNSETDPSLGNLAQQYFDQYLEAYESDLPRLIYDKNVNLHMMRDSALENLATLHLENRIDNPDKDYAADLLKLLYRNNDEEPPKELKEQWFGEALSATGSPEEKGAAFNWTHVIEELGLDVLSCEQQNDDLGIICLALDDLDEIEGEDDTFDVNGETIEMFILNAPLYDDIDGALSEDCTTFISEVNQMESITFPYLMVSSFAVFREENGRFYTPVLVITKTGHRLISLYPGMGTEGLRKLVLGDSPFIDGESYSTTPSIAIAINQLARGGSISDLGGEVTCAKLDTGWFFPFYDECMQG